MLHALLHELRHAHHLVQVHWIVATSAAAVFLLFATRGVVVKVRNASAASED